MEENTFQKLVIDDMKEMKADIKLLLADKNRRDGITKVFSGLTVFLSVFLSAALTLAMKIYFK